MQVTLDDNGHFSSKLWDAIVSPSADLSCMCMHVIITSVDVKRIADEDLDRMTTKMLVLLTRAQSDAIVTAALSLCTHLGLQLKLEFRRHAIRIISYMVVTTLVQQAVSDVCERALRALLDSCVDVVRSLCECVLSTTYRIATVKCLLSASSRSHYLLLKSKHAYSSTNFERYALMCV